MGALDTLLQKTFSNIQSTASRLFGGASNFIQQNPTPASFVQQYLPKVSLPQTPSPQTYAKQNFNSIPLNSTPNSVIANKLQNFSFKPAQIDVPNQIASRFGGGSEVFKTQEQQPVYLFRNLQQTAQQVIKNPVQSIAQAGTGMLDIANQAFMSNPELMGATSIIKPTLGALATQFGIGSGITAMQQLAQGKQLNPKQIAMGGVQFLPFSILGTHSLGYTTSEEKVTASALRDMGIKLFRTDLKSLIKNSPELAKNPELTFEGGMLKFKGQTHQMAIDPKALGIDSAKLVEGDTVNIKNVLTDKGNVPVLTQVIGTKPAGGGTRTPSISISGTPAGIQDLSTGSNLQPLIASGERSTLNKLPFNLKNEDSIQSYITTVRQKMQTKIPELEQFVKETTGLTPNSRIKDIGSLQGKIQRYIGRGEDPLKIADTLGTRIPATTPQNAIEIANKLQSTGKIVETQNFFQNPTNWGYEGINMKVRLQDGSLAEIQVHTPQSLEIATKIHKVYTKWRDLNPSTLTGSQMKAYEADRASSLKIAQAVKGVSGGGIEGVNSLQTLQKPELLTQTAQGLPEVLKVNKGKIPSSQISSKISSQVRSIITDQGNIKERGFITTVKNAEKLPQGVKDIVSGSYVVRSNKQLKTDALKLIQSDPVTAERLALNPQTDVHVQVGNELLNYYASKGDFAKAKAIAEGMAQSGTSLGQAVQAFSQYDKTTPEGALRFAQSKINEYNKVHPQAKLTVTDKQVQDLFNSAHKIQTMPQGRERNIASNYLMEKVNNLIPSTFVDKAITVWKAGLLTSLRTTERNLLGNTIQGAAEVAKDIPANFADKLMGLKTGKRSMTFTTQGVGTGAKQGVQSAKDIVTTGFDPTQQISKYDVRHVTWGNNTVEQGLKKYTDFVFRTLGAQDKPFWQSSFARSLYDQAGAEAINAGKQGDKVFIENLVNKPTEQMMLSATKDANIATFHDQSGLSKIANAFKKEMGKNEITKAISEIFAPFTGVPSSIATQIISYSPIGLVKGAINTGKVLAGSVPELQRQAAQEVGRGVMGTGLFGLGAYLMSKGLMTGQPKDTKEADQWTLEGKQANSIMIGGKWRSINSIGPQNLILLAGAKAQAERQKGSEASIGTFAGNFAKDFMGQTFLQGMSAPLNVITDPVRYGPSYAGNQMASAVPNIIKDTSKAFDPYARENNKPLDYVTNSIPGLRNQNLIKRDVLGNPIPQQPTGLGAYLDLFNSKTPIVNPVVNELSRLNDIGSNATPSKITAKQTINGVKMQLTPEQLNILESTAGPQVINSLNQLIQTQGYQTLGDEEKANAINSIISQVRKQVKGTIDLNSSTQPTNKNLSGQYTLINQTTGAVKNIDLSTPLTPPISTGLTELDKLATAKYSNSITTRINDIYSLFLDGQISQSDANSQIVQLKGLKTTGTLKVRLPSLRPTLKKSPKVKVPKISLGKLKVKKAKKIKLLKAKSISLKPLKVKGA